MIFGFGVDLVHVPRIVALITRRDPNNFARRILSDAEFVKWETEHRGAGLFEDARFLAVRWAIKEAAYKALYPHRPTFKELSYHKLGSLGPGSKPTVTYLPRDGTELEISAIHCSVSHDGPYVYAAVLVEK